MNLSDDTVQIELLPETIPLEKRLAAAGYGLICGVDEAGRGPLAGPVVAAAVLYEDCDIIWCSHDSKVLKAERRAELFEQLTASLAYGIGVCNAEEIEAMNILQASLEAMQRAIRALPRQPEYVVVDGNQTLCGSWPCKAIVKGDSLVHTIGAASVIAKVTRDRLMIDAAKQFPHYGFDRHFGYPTEAHRAAIKKYGPCAIHRRLFRGVREYLLEAAQIPSS